MYASKTTVFVEALKKWMDAGYDIPKKGRVIYENKTVIVYKIGWIKTTKYAVIK